MKTKHRKASHAKRKYMAADPLSIYRRGEWPVHSTALLS
mgnify:FL=1